MSSDTIGAKCVVVLKAAKRAGEVPWPKVAEIIDGVVSAEQFSLKTDEPEKPKPERKRNPLVDGIIEACGHDPLKATKTALQAAGVAVASIKEVHPDVNVSEIKRCAALYKRKNPTWPITPSAIAAHWHEFPTVTNTLETKTPDPYTAPENWRELASKVYPGADFSDREWSDIAITIRQDLVKKIA